MNILKNLRSIFGSPANLSPVASLPLGEVQLPGSRPVTLVTAPAQAAAPVATGLVRGNPPDLDQHIRAIGAMSVKDFMSATSQVRVQASRSTAARPAGTRPAPRAKSAPAPALEDDNQTATPAPPADDVGDIVKQLEKCLEMLKGLHPDLNADDADADEAQARACLARGDKGGALRGYDAAITKWGARIAAKNASSALRSQPSSRQRASALIRGGFAAQAQVQKIEACLHGPRPGPAAISTPAVPTSITAPAAGVTTTSTAEDVARIKSIEAEIKNIDAEYRKTGVYSPDAQARHATLSRQLSAAKKKFHVS